jgi:predicted Fe-S protein YdhL (DUF1289 family)
MEREREPVGCVHYSVRTLVIPSRRRPGGAEDGEESPAGSRHHTPAVSAGDSSPRFTPPGFRRLGMTVLFLLLILACDRTNIDRTQWQSMSPNEKTLYVRTLIGHEKTKEAKGGNDRVFTQNADDYVKRIDNAYARGDQRNVDVIFEEMGTPR